MRTATPSAKTYCGKPVDAAPTAFGPLRPSTDIADDHDELSRRFNADGYLFLPGYLDRKQVFAARRSMLERLDAEGHIDRRHPLLEGVVNPEASEAFRPDLAKENDVVHRLLYSGRMMDFFTLFLGDTVRHFDYTWVRCKGGEGGRTPTYPHYDITYMGRGTDRLYTAWTPLGDIPFEMGGLMVLEGSHQHPELRDTYGRFDVDKRCRNTPDGLPPKSWEGEFGWYNQDAFKVRAELGGRWLSAEYRAGDLLVFGMYTMHASMDNHTNRWRLSTDSRYQLASEPADERWIGDDPPGHGPRAKRTYIC